MDAWDVLGQVEAPGYEPRVRREHVAAEVLPFWARLFGKEPGFISLTSGFVIGKNLHGLIEKRFEWPSGDQEAVDWITRQALLGRDIYMSGRIMGSARKCKGRCVTSVFAEVEESQLRLLPEPTFVIASSPTLRQCYWRLDDPAEPQHVAPILKKMHAKVDVLLMIPGTPNNRFFGGPKVEILHESSATYPLHKIKGLLPDFSKTSDATGWQPVLERHWTDSLAAINVAASTVMKTAAGSMAVAAAIAASFLLPRANSATIDPFGAPLPARGTASLEDGALGAANGEAVTIETASHSIGSLSQSSAGTKASIRKSPIIKTEGGQENPPDEPTEEDVPVVSVAAGSEMDLARVAWNEVNQTLSSQGV